MNYRIAALSSLQESNCFGKVNSSSHVELIGLRHVCDTKVDDSKRNIVVAKISI